MTFFPLSATRSKFCTDITYLEYGITVATLRICTNAITCRKYAFQCENIFKCIVIPSNLHTTLHSPMERFWKIMSE